MGDHLRSCASTAIAERRAAARPPAPARRRTATPPAIGATASTAASASVTDQPSPSSPARTWSRQPSPASLSTATGPARRCRVGAPIRSLSSSTIRCAPLRPMPGTGAQRDEVLGGDGPAQLVGAVHGEHRLRQLGADPARRLEQLEHRTLVVVGEAEQGQRVLADDHRGGQRGLLADAQGGERGRACTSPASRRRRRRRRPSPRRPRRPVPRTNAIMQRRLLAAARATACSSRLVALRRARCGTSRAPARRQRRRLTAARVEAQHPGDHRGHLGLVGAAAAGDGRLDLARRVQRDRDAATGRRDHGDPGRPGRCPSRCGRCAGRRPARPRPRRAAYWSSHASRCALDRHQPVAEIGVGRRADDVDGHRAAAGADGVPSTTPSPQRVSPGSTPSTRMSALLVVGPERTGVRSGSNVARNCRTAERRACRSLSGPGVSRGSQANTTVQARPA